MRKHTIYGIATKTLLIIISAIHVCVMGCDSSDHELSEMSESPKEQTPHDDLLYIPKEAHDIRYHQDNEEALAPGAGVSYKVPPEWTRKALESELRQELSSLGWKSLKKLTLDPYAMGGPQRGWVLIESSSEDDIFHWLEGWVHPEKQLTMTSEIYFSQREAYVMLNVVQGEAARKRINRYLEVNSTLD